MSALTGQPYMEVCADRVIHRDALVCVCIRARTSLRRIRCHRLPLVGIR